MKILLAVLSCERDRWAHRQARETWVKDCPVDYRFFLGKQCRLFKEDEFALNADDSDQTAKVRTIFKWALAQNYDYVFKCDIDTYVCVPRLLASGFEQHDWVANGNPMRPYGGSGYWLSRKAMLALDGGEDAATKRPHVEDWWVGDNLVKLGFTPHIDHRYHSATNVGPQPDNDLITSHWYGEAQSYSGPVAPPPRLVFSEERLRLIHKYHGKFIGGPHGPTRPD